MIRFRPLLTSSTMLLGALALACLLMSHGIAQAEEESSGLDLPIDIAVDFTYSSLYYWRGFEAGFSSFAMPSIDVSYSTDAISAGVNIWYAQGFEADDTEGSDNSEVDYTVYAGLTAGPVDISAGVIDYTIPAGAPFTEGHVLEANVGIAINTLPFDNSVAVYINLDGETDAAGESANSVYIAPRIGYTYEDWSLGLTLGLAVGESDYYGTTGAAIIDITPGVSYSIPFGGAQASISLNLGYNPENGTKIPFFTFGTGFSL